MRYFLVYKDKINKSNYYYNLDNNLVYINKNTDKLSIVGIIGIIIGYVIYLGLAISSYYFSNSLLFIIITGIIYGVILSQIANRTIKNIFKTKGRKVAKPKLLEMYNKNKVFRIEYFLLTLIFLILSIIEVIFYDNVTIINFLLLTTIIMSSFLIFLYRPVNCIKFHKIIKK